MYILYTNAKLNDIGTVLSQGVIDIATDHRHNIMFYSIINISYIRPHKKIIG